MAGESTRRGGGRWAGHPCGSVHARFLAWACPSWAGWRRMPAPRVPLLALLHGDTVRGQPAAVLLPRLPARSLEARIGAGEKRSLERVAPAAGRTGIRHKLQQPPEQTAHIVLGRPVQEASSTYCRRTQ